MEPKSHFKCLKFRTSFGYLATTSSAKAQLQDESKNSDFNEWCAQLDVQRAASIPETVLTEASEPQPRRARNRREPVHMNDFFTASSLPPDPPLPPPAATSLEYSTIVTAQSRTFAKKFIVSEEGRKFAKLFSMVQIAAPFIHAMVSNNVSWVRATTSRPAETEVKHLILLLTKHADGSVVSRAQTFDDLSLRAAALYEVTKELPGALELALVQYVGDFNDRADWQQTVVVSRASNGLYLAPTELFMRAVFNNHVSSLNQFSNGNKRVMRCIFPGLYHPNAPLPQRSSSNGTTGVQSATAPATSNSMGTNGEPRRGAIGVSRHSLTRRGPQTQPHQFAYRPPPPGPQHQTAVNSMSQPRGSQSQSLAHVSIHTGGGASPPIISLAGMYTPVPTGIRDSALMEPPPGLAHPPQYFAARDTSDFQPITQPPQSGEKVGPRSRSGSHQSSYYSQSAFGSCPREPSQSQQRAPHPMPAQVQQPYPAAQRYQYQQPLQHPSYPVHPRPSR